MTILHVNTFTARSDLRMYGLRALRYMPSNCGEVPFFILRKQTCQLVVILSDGLGCQTFQILVRTTLKDHATCTVSANIDVQSCINQIPYHNNYSGIENSSGRQQQRATNTPWLGENCGYSRRKSPHFIHQFFILFSVIWEKEHDANLLAFWPKFHKQVLQVVVHPPHPSHCGARP